MADRITFRERTLGVCQAVDVGDIKAVSITEPRVKFIKGWITGGTEPGDGSVECGDGTEYPMLVTPAQLFEIMYRVRDSKWTSGTATQTVDDGEDEFFQSIVTFTAATPSSKVQWEIQGGGLDAAYTRRAYTAVNNDETPDQPMEEYGDDYFSTVAYLTVGGINGGSTYPLAWREAVREQSLFLNALRLTEPNHAGYYESGEIVDDLYISQSPADQIKNGFSFHGASWTDSFVTPTIYAPFSTFEDSTAGPPYPYLGAMVQLVFTRTVAWIDENNSGNPFDPLNKLYLGLKFNITNSFSGTSGLFSHSTFIESLEAPVSAKLADLKLKLSDGSFVTAPIYGSERELGFVAPTIATATDWVFEATEWWPYKLKNGSPAWNTTTGAPLADISS